MTRKHYKVLARVAGDALAIATLAGGEQAREEVYNEVYLPLSLMLQEDAPSFDTLRFSHAVAVAEASYLDAARSCGRTVPA